MKKVIYSLLAGVLMLASCSDFTELQPKGKNLLASTDDIELLLNSDIDPYNSDMRNITGVIYAYSSMSATIAQVPQTRNGILLSYADDDNSLTRMEILTSSDSYYTAYYSYIGKICNPILNQIDAATGPEAKKAQLKAEALTLRAWSHYMILQKYAKAYNPATAESDPAVVYLTEDVDIQVPQPKKTVAEAYQMCLDDINAAIELNAVPSKAVTPFRLSKAATYAVKALICLNMQKYAEAKEAANKAIAENGALYDYYANVETAFSMAGVPYQTAAVDAKDNPEVYFDAPDLVYYAWVSPTLVEQFEEGYATYSLFPKMGDQYKGISVIMPAYAIYEDYGATLGVPGWEGGFDLNHYVNTSGLSTPNMYLTIAEAEIKSNNIDAAMTALDILRAKRIDPAKYQPLKGSVTSKADAIKALKAAYLPENLWTYWGFIGLKRWNVDTEWKQSLNHTIEGKTYTLSPESNLWVFPFPANVRDKNANLTSNKNK